MDGIVQSTMWRKLNDELFALSLWLVHDLWHIMNKSQAKAKINIRTRKKQYWHTYTHRSNSITLKLNQNCTKCSVCKINQIICIGEKTFELFWTEFFLCQNIKFYDVPRSKVARLQFPFDHETLPIFSQWCDFVCEALAICWMLLKAIRSMLFDSIIFQLLWHILLAMRMMPRNISLPKIQ